MGIKGEWVSGNVFIRPNDVYDVGVPTQRHLHNFDHTTFAQIGWWLVRGVLPDQTEIINQFASEEYRRVRELQLKYEPHLILRPIRFADIKVVTAEKTINQFHIEFIKIGDDVPEGGVEIQFEPQFSHRLIRADVEHEFVLLSEGGGRFDCVYSHRAPQGEVVQTCTGWTPGYV